MTAKLVYRTPQGRIATVALTGPSVCIGRDSTCEVRIADILLSAQHCSIQKKEGSWILQDLESANRTYVNDQEGPISTHALRSRDVIRCGAQWLQFIAPEDEVLDIESLGSEVIEPQIEKKASDDAAQAESQRLIASLREELVEQQRVSGRKEVALYELRRETKAIEAQLRAATEKSDQYERASLSLTRQLREREERLATLQAQLRAASESDTTAQAKISEFRASQQHLEKSSTATMRQLEVSEENLARTLETVRSLQNRQSDLEKILAEKERSIGELRSGSTTGLAEMRVLIERCSEQERAIAQHKIAFEALQIEHRQRRLTLEQAEQSLRESEVERTRLARLISSQRDGAAELTRQTSELARLQVQLETLRETQQIMVSFYGDMNGALLGAEEKAFALKVGIARAAPALTDVVVSRQLIDASENALSQIHDAQGQLRGLLRMIRQDNSER